MHKIDYSNYYTDDGSAAPSYSDHARPSYIDPDTKEAGYQVHQVSSKRNRRRICGLSFFLFIALAVAAVLVLIGAVVGGVVGTMASHNASRYARTLRVSL